MSRARIGLIGAGWRAEYFVRIAAALPQHFEIARVLVRTRASAASVTANWNVPAVTSLDDFLRGERFDFVVVSTPAAVARELIEALVAADVAVLTETPPAPDVASLRSLWGAVGGARVQVAEQYHLQPHQFARIAAARSGLIGDVTSARISAAHGYHGVSLARRALGVQQQPVEITAQRFDDPLVTSRGRDGWKPTLEVVPNPRTTAVLRFDTAQTALFDFAEEQYWSPARSRHVSIHGSRGEVDDDSVAYLEGAGHAVSAVLARVATGIDGDLGGAYLERIVLHAHTLYENRFAPARLNDDELAVAEVMHRMAVFVGGGAGFYSLAEASHDQYLALLIERAVDTGATQVSEPMPWSRTEFGGQAH